MQLTFPFRNKVYHDLDSFLKAGKIRDYTLIRENRYPYSENYFEKDIEFFRSSVVNFESELLQVIDTTTKQTIDQYFKELMEYTQHLKDNIVIDGLKNTVCTANDNILLRFKEQIEKDTEEYFKSE